MPRYTFKLNDDGNGVEDDFGVSLPNAEIAYRYDFQPPMARTPFSMIHELADNVAGGDAKKVTVHRASVTVVPVEN